MRWKRIRGENFIGKNVETRTKKKKKNIALTGRKKKVQRTKFSLNIRWNSHFFHFYNSSTGEVAWDGKPFLVFVFAFYAVGFFFFTVPDHTLSYEFVQKHFFFPENSVLLLKKKKNASLHQTMIVRRTNFYFDSPLTCKPSERWGRGEILRFHAAQKTLSASCKYYRDCALFFFFVRPREKLLSYRDFIPGTADVVLDGVWYERKIIIHIYI